MTKYRIRLNSGRVIGPFVFNQLVELRSKGHILGDEEAQEFPTGAWGPISKFDFYPALMDDNRTAIIETAPQNEETFVIDITKLRNEKVERELDALDVVQHEPVQQLTQTLYIGSNPDKTVVRNDDLLKTLVFDRKKAGLSINPMDKTLINPIAQKEIELMRKKKKEKEEEERALVLANEIDEDEKKEDKNQNMMVPIDESTQMINLDSMKLSLIDNAEEAEQVLEQEIQELKQKKKVEEKNNQDENNEEESEEDSKKKKKNTLIAVAILALLYAFIFPDENGNNKTAIPHVEPQIEFPIPFDKADKQKGKTGLEKGRELFSAGDYISLIKAGKYLKASYENDIESEDALSLLVRNYAEQLPYSRADKLGDAQIVFNLIQAKKPYLARNPNGVIGLNLFYMAINKYEAAADAVAKYLRLYPQNVTQDLFAVYLKTLMKIGKLDEAKQFLQPLLRAPEKNRYTYDALIEYYLMNQEDDEALKYVNEAIKNYPKLVGFYLKKADMMIKAKKFAESKKLLAKAKDLKLENNNKNKAKYLELMGLLEAHKGDTKKATAYFKQSLRIEDSYELRMRLADLSTSKDPKNETDKLIAESKAVKLLGQAKEFYSKKSYTLAVSSAAKAADAYPGHIPSELFLAEVQLRMGMAKQALKTLEALIKKYPDDKSINLALIDAYIKTYKFNDAKNRIGIISGTDLKQTYEFASVNGRLYKQMGDKLQAISWLRNSIARNPLNDEDQFLFAEVLMSMNKFKDAKQLVDKAIELDPVNPDYRVGYARILYEDIDDQAAIGYLLSLLPDFGESPRILSEIAVFYYRAGKLKDFESYKEKIENLPVKDKALYEFQIRAASLDERYNDIPILVEQLLEVEPGNLEAMMTAGKVLYEEGKIKQAKEWFDRVLEKLESYPNARYYIAKINYLAKAYDMALTEVEKDLKENGENDLLLTLMAQIWVEKGDLVKAENYFKKAQKLNSRGYESLVGLADISTKRNNFDLALDLYKKAMAVKGDEPIIHKKIGDVYRLLGQGALAVEAYKLYLEMSPEALDRSQVQSYINLML